MTSVIKPRSLRGVGYLVDGLPALLRLFLKPPICVLILGRDQGLKLLEREFGALLPVLCTFSHDLKLSLQLSQASAHLTHPLA